MAFRVRVKKPRIHMVKLMEGGQVAARCGAAVKRSRTDEWTIWESVVTCAECYLQSPEWEDA